MSSNHLFNVCLAAVLAIGLTACSSSDNDAPAEEPVAMPEPMPEPDPEPEPDPAPTDLEDTQAAAAAAAAAAMMASANAEASSDSAAAATATLATLQTGKDANSGEMGGNEAAYAAKAAAAEAATAASDAAAASAAAAAATTGDAGEAAWRMAVAAQEAAEAAEATAALMAAAAIEAAMTELHIVGTVKSAGIEQEDGTIVVSSVDAKMGKLTTPAEVDTDPDIVTGLQNDVMREDSGEVKGQQHSLPGVTPVVPYKQAVEARDLAIGQTLDTTDDKARVTVIHSRAGSKKASVYAIDGTITGNIVITTDQDNAKTATDGGTAITWVPELKSVGMYYEATQTTPAADDPTTLVDETAGDEPTALDHSDVVGEMTKSKRVYSYLHLGADSAEGGGDDTTRYVVETTRTVNVGGTTAVTYQHVDTTAPAAPDSPDSDGLLQQVGVKADIPMAVKYDHIHFGVWAGLGEPDDRGDQELTDLGIGFVQSVGDGETERLGIGTATYNGDWVAVIQRQNSAGEGAFHIGDGPATMTADFDKDEFKADLEGLAMLEGTLDGNGFSGTKASEIVHDELNSSGKFTGEFSGHIYGEKGTEAAGVFDFAGGEDGSFRGAFGGSNQE